MTESVADNVVIEDLFFEQDIDILAPCYKHGILRSLFILSRSLIFSRPAQQSVEDFVMPSSSLAVVFFSNDFHAADQAPACVGIDRILRMDLHSLAIVREKLGLLGTFREVTSFVRRALKLKGPRYIGRLTYPLLGWLLYRTFQTMLSGKSDVTIVTTNMVHPLYIGVAWAALSSGQSSEFLEHATTPRIAFRDRGYRHYYVNFPHTRQMMIELGVSADRVHALCDIALAPACRPSVQVRTVGLCINFFDSIESIIDVTEVLLRHDLVVIYRVHDADPRVSQLKQLARRKGLEFDGARASSIDLLLRRVDLVVAGNSNVIADALIARKPVIYYWAGSPLMYDYYGLVAHFRIPRATNKVEFDVVLGAAVRTGPQC